jgi:hypothetical protein
MNLINEEKTMSTAVLEQPTVGDLEAKILAGEHVSPGEMATAKAADAAAEHINKLVKKRTEAEERQRVKQEALEAFSAIRERFGSLVKTDTEVSALIVEVESLPLKYRKAVGIHNTELQKIRDDLSRLSGQYKGILGDHFAITVDHNGGHVTIGDDTIKHIPDYATDLQLALDAGLREALNHKDGVK